MTSNSSRMRLWYWFLLNPAPENNNSSARTLLSSSWALHIVNMYQSNWEANCLSQALLDSQSSLLHRNLHMMLFIHFKETIWSDLARLWNTPIVTYLDTTHSWDNIWPIPHQLFLFLLHVKLRFPCCVSVFRGNTFIASHQILSNKMPSCMVQITMPMAIMGSRLGFSNTKNSRLGICLGAHTPW